MLGLKVNPWPRAAVLWENLRWEESLGQNVRNYFALRAEDAPTGVEPKLAVNVWVRNSEYSGL